MGQSNSTSPLLITITNQTFKDFNYSRLILQNDSIKSADKQNLKQPKVKASPTEHFKLNRFDSLNGDDLLVRDRQNKLVQGEQQVKGTTLKNISNLKLTKQRSSVSNSSNHLKLTSINHLQLPSQQGYLGQSQKNKPSHVKFYSTHRLVCKNYIIHKTFDEERKKFVTKVTNYFIEEEDMENYVSNLIKLKQVLMDLELYEDFSILEEDGLYIVERVYSAEIEFSKLKLSKKMFQSNIQLFLDYLCFLAKIYQKIDDIYIDPEDIYMVNDEFYLVDFKYKEIHPFDMLLATIQWVFKTVQQDPNKIIQQKLLRVSSQSHKHQKTLQQCFIRKDQLQNSSSFPLYVRQLWKNLVQKKIQRKELLPYITRLKCKAITLSMKIDSFHACYNHKKTWMFQQEKHSWILGKKFNQIYFYNINDDHPCQVKVVRKKKKIDLSQIKLVFDPEQLQIKYIAQNSKLIVHISEFQLQKSSCLSDIEIKYRLPVKFKNPFVFFNHKNQEVYILQSCVYKYLITENKIFQETKRISDCIFLARSHDCAFVVIKMSIDIFRNGIRVFMNHTQVDLLFVGEQSFLDEVANIRVDIRVVDFCKEIYKGVYLMLANRNLWILDLNFSVFYSFATIERVKAFYGFSSVANSSSATKGLYNHQNRKHHSKVPQTNNLTEYAFQIFNQPFGVQFLSYQQGLNVKIKDDQLHIIGEIQGNMYYLNYSFMPQAGSLKLLSYKPLFGTEHKSRSNQDNNNDIKKNCDSDQSIGSKKEKKVKIAEQNNQWNTEVLNQSKQRIHQPVIPINIKSINKGKSRNSNRVSGRNSRPIDDIAILKFLKETYLDESIESFYHFNFHEENLLSYKIQPWLFFYEPYFVIAHDFHLKTNKTNYQIQLKINKTKCSLKDLIEKIKKSNETKSTKDKKWFSKEQSLFYMLRCLQIYEWLVQNELYHRNFSIGNLYFMESDNSLKLIGWSEPPRNWYVSDFKDLLLVFFNIITCNSLQKLNEKTLQKYKAQLDQFSVIYEKMLIAFKYMKVSQKKAEIEKQIKQIRESLLKQLTNLFFVNTQSESKSLKLLGSNESQKQFTTKDKRQVYKGVSDDFIFNFEFNTPRFSMVSISKKKMKKMKCLLDQNSKEQLIFKSTDKYIWNEQKGILYMFTTAYQFYELKINTQTFKEQVLVCEEYEYLPNNILQSTFTYVANYGILSIGGIYKAKDTQLTFNRTVYQFNDEKLTWDKLCEIPEPRVNPYVVISKQGTQLYCLGGQIDHSSQQMHILKMDLVKQLNHKKQTRVQLLFDPLPFNPFSHVLSSYPSKVYNISSEFQLFLLFAVTGQKYLVRLFSLNSFCMDLHLDAKNYSDDNKIISPTVGIALNKGTIHLLRQYGKYAKINLNKLQSLTVNNETVYPQREQKHQG